MRGFANWLSPLDIRVNTVHPTGVATPMVEISNAVLLLVGDDGRYVTGTTLPVDAGFLAR